MPREKLIIPSAELLGMEREETQQVIDDLIEDREIVQDFFEDKPYIFLIEEYMDERSIADRIKVMLKFPPAKGRIGGREIDAIEEKKGITFESKQREAILTAVNDGLLVLTGGPGTGKTTTLNGILELFEKKKLQRCPEVLCSIFIT